MQSMLSGLKGKRYSMQIDLTSGFYQMPITEKDKHKIVFRNADGQLWEFSRPDFGSIVLTPAFIKIIKTSRSLPDRYVVSCLDDILISDFLREEYLDAVRRVFKKVLRASVSVNFAKCNFPASF